MKTIGYLQLSTLWIIIATLHDGFWAQLFLNLIAVGFILLSYIDKDE